MGMMDTSRMQWTREPLGCAVGEDRIEIITAPHTDLWQRTYYHFRNDSAPVLQTQTDEPYFSFVVKTDFSGSHCRFDQCGVVMYLDAENWLKASVEYENESFQHLGSVVTNNGYSDWATTAIPADVKTMWYRFSRREDDYRIECSRDGVEFSQMRICHMWKGSGKIRFGTGDPGSTGELLAAAAVMYIPLKGKLKAMPDFEEKVFEGEGELKGRIFLGRVIYLAARFWFDKNFRASKHNFEVLKKKLKK